MNGNTYLLEILFYALLAGFLVIRLFSVLGKRTGNEKGRDPFAPTGNGDNVVDLPSRVGKILDEDEEDLISPELTPLEMGLSQIAAVDSSFSPERFVSGATSAFEMILGAFAKGDREVLKPLLSDEVFAQFEDAIAEREAAKETMESELIGVKSVEIIEAVLEERLAEVTVTFVTDQVNVIKDAEGKEIEGDSNRITTIKDTWTFSRDTRSRNPNWLLIATGSPDEE